MPSNNPKFQVAGGATPVPNWLHDSPALNGSEKLVAWSLHRSAFGTSTTTNVGGQHIAKTHGLDRRTVKKATERLRALAVIVPIGEPIPGFAQQYEFALTKPKALSDAEGGVRISTPGDAHFHTRGDAHFHTTIKSSKTIKDYAPLGGTSSIALQAEPGNGLDSAPERDESVESDAYVEPDVHGFGSALVRDGSAVSDGNAEPGSTGEGIAAKQPATKMRPGESAPRSAQAYTKREVNDLMLTPEGLRASDDLDDLDYDLRNLVLPEVCGENLNRGTLDKLIELHGVRYCKFWTHWLKRKIADEYARGRPVQKPTALYIKAVRERWQVDPNWPEFDAELHTAAAREEASKRQKAAPAGALIPGTTHTQDDVNRFADEIHCGEREMWHLPAYLYGPVQRRLDELESNSAAEEDEVEELFGSRTSDAEFELEEIPF